MSRPSEWTQSPALATYALDVNVMIVGTKAAATATQIPTTSIVRPMRERDTRIVISIRRRVHEVGRETGSP